MKTRILTALILACVLAAAFFQPFPALPTVVVSVLCAIMTWEILRCTGLLKKRIFLVPSMLFAVLTPILAYTELKGAFAAAIVLLMVYLFICCVQYGQIDLSQALTTAALLMYAVGCMVCLIRIDRTPLRFSAHPDMPTGRLFWLLCLLCAALTDVFAYFGGTLFGKKKLCPKLSPHKTVEGSLFGLGGSVLTWLAFGGIFSVFCGAKVHFGMFVLFGLLTAATAECGDLFASLIKRTYKIKDFGTILPGHGGIFDRFDSLLPVAAMMSAILCDGRLTSLLMTL